MSEISFKFDTDRKTVKKYAEDTGIPIRTVQDMVHNGDLPILPKKYPKAKVFINMVALYQQAATASLSR